MRGAGCTWNDITDRDYDGKVARTALRPIPAGEVSVKQAIAFAVAQCLIGFVILIQFNLRPYWSASPPSAGRGLSLHEAGHSLAAGLAI